MGFLGDFLFGSEPEAQFKQLERWTPEQKELMKKFSGWAGEGVGEPGEAYPGESPYGGELSQLSLAGLESMFGPEGAFGQGGKLESIIKGGPEDFEDYYQKSVYDPMMRQFEEETIPSIGRQVGSAYWGSERLGQEESAREDLMQSLVGARSKMAYGARESALDRSLQAMGMAPGMYGEGMEMGAAPGQWEYSEWQRQQEDPYRKAQMILQALGLSGFENIGIGVPGQAGFLQSLAGGAGQAGGAFGMGKILGLI